MTIYKIKQSIQDLTAKYTDMNATSFREKVLIAYVNQMLDKLTSVLNQHADNTELSNIFQVILTENWALVNGTALCYTALPAQDITMLLCEIAQFVTNEKTLIPVEVLMPGMAIESYHDGYDDIVADTNLKTLLQTHVLSNGGTSLLPVKLITELDLSAASTQLGNPYFDAFKHLDNGYVDAEEYKRLVSHSALTQAVFDTKQEFELLTSDTCTLLGQLKQLCMQLDINGIGNLGTEKNAGSGAYSAIINFMEYYNKLTTVEKNKIPVHLNTEINLLLTLVTDSIQNINATEKLDTSISRRRYKLIATMRGHDETLSQISLSSTKRESLIRDARIHFDTARVALAAAIEKNTYSEGHDHLNLNAALLNALNVKLNLSCLADLEILKTFDPAEITSVCIDADLRRQIVEQLRNLENLVIFIKDMPVKKLAAFLTINNKELVNAFIRSPHDLNVLLRISMDIEKCTAIVAALADRLPSIIPLPDDFNCMVRFLSREQYTAVYEGMKKSMPNIIKLANYFTRVMSYLVPEQRIELYEIMKERLPRIIKSKREFIDVLKELTPEQCAAVCKAMKEDLPRIIESNDYLYYLHDFTYNFSLVLRELTPEKSIAVCEGMKESWPGIIKSREDFSAVLKYLTIEQGIAVCKAMKESLLDIIKSGKDFGAVMLNLSPEGRTVVYEIMEDRLPNIIKSGEDFSAVLKYLTRKQRTAVYEGMKDRLLNIFKSGTEFHDVLHYLSQAQRTATYEIIKNRLPDIIKSGREFSDALHFLTPEQRTAVCEDMKESLFNIIKSGYDSFFVLEYLTQSQCIAVCENVDYSLWDIIDLGENINIVLYYLKPKKRQQVEAAIVEHNKNMQYITLRKEIIRLCEIHSQGLTTDLHLPLIYDKKTTQKKLDVMKALVTKYKTDFYNPTHSYKYSVKDMLDFINENFNTFKERRDSFLVDIGKIIITLGLICLYRYSQNWVVTKSATDFFKLKIKADNLMSNDNRNDYLEEQASSADLKSMHR